MPQAEPAHTPLALQCDSCGAQLNVERGMRTATCPYCASPAVVEREGATGLDPTFFVGFGVLEMRALEMARAWIRRPLFAPSKFRRAKAPDIRGVYVPAYLYTAAAHAEYSAQIGENYTIVETYTTTDSQGRTVTRTRTRTVTEWRSLSGRYAAYVSDRVVTASRGLNNRMLEAIEPFDFRELRRFTTKAISGWAAEDPSMTPEQCKTLGRDEAMEEIGRRLAGHMPGDSHRALKFSARLAFEDLELLYVPVWVLAIRYDDDKPPVRLLINGQTGKLAGKAPFSWPKFFALIGVISALIAGLVLLAEVI